MELHWRNWQNARRKEHKRNVQHNKIGSNIANHAWTNNHSIDFNNGKIIDKGNYRLRRTLESWDNACTKNSDNNSKHLPSNTAFYLERITNMSYRILIAYIGLIIIFVTCYLYVIVNHCNYRTFIFIYPLKTADWQSKARNNKS